MAAASVLEPTDHNPMFAPVIHPMLESGVQAIVNATLDALQS